MAIRFSLLRYLRRLLDLVVGRPIVAYLGLAGGVLVGTGVLVAMFGAIGTSPADAAATAAYRPDVESLLDTRSPGGRRYGWLLGTKADRVAANGPVERVLSSVRERPAAAPEASGVAVPLGALGTPFPIAPDAAPTALSDLAPLGLAGPGLSSGAPIAGGVLPGVGGGGGGTGGGDNPGTTPPDTPASPVPEPSVWAMLILGLALIGGAWRRAPRARGSALAAAPR